MQTNEGELLVWRAVSAALEEADPVEFSMIADIAASSIESPRTIDRQPGAMDLGQFTPLASVLYGAVVPVVMFAAPKLFDAALEITKERLKKVLERRSESKRSLPSQHLFASVDQIREMVRIAATSRNLSARTADTLADALIAQLVMQRQAAADVHGGKT